MNSRLARQSILLVAWLGALHGCGSGECETPGFDVVSYRSLDDPAGWHTCPPGIVCEWWGRWGSEQTCNDRSPGVCLDTVIEDLAAAEITAHDIGEFGCYSFYAGCGLPGPPMWGVLIAGEDVSQIEALRPFGDSRYFRVSACCGRFASTGGEWVDFINLPCDQGW